MKSNELRIGNLVLYYNDDTVFTVEEITETGLSVCNENEQTWIELDQFSGIPITEEWLFELGFKEDDGWYEKNGIGLYLKDKRCVQECGQYSYNQLPFPEYIHTLQNLYFALKEEELTLQH